MAAAIRPVGPDHVAVDDGQTTLFELALDLVQVDAGDDVRIQAVGLRAARDAGGRGAVALGLGVAHQLARPLDRRVHLAGLEVQLAEGARHHGQAGGAAVGVVPTGDVLVGVGLAAVLRDPPLVAVLVHLARLVRHLDLFGVRILAVVQALAQALVRQAAFLHAGVPDLLEVRLVALLELLFRDLAVVVGVVGLVALAGLLGDVQDAALAAGALEQLVLTLVVPLAPGGAAALDVLLGAELAVLAGEALHALGLGLAQALFELLGHARRAVVVELGAAGLVELLLGDGLAVAVGAIVEAAHLRELLGVQGAALVGVEALEAVGLALGGAELLERDGLVLVEVHALGARQLELGLAELAVRVLVELVEVVLPREGLGRGRRLLRRGLGGRRAGGRGRRGHAGGGRGGGQLRRLGGRQRHGRGRRDGFEHGWYPPHAIYARKPSF
ncbi:hypothetical protein D3C72_993560 [compost metagenome]